MAKQKLVVIGNGMAGMKTVETLLEANPEQYSITVFGAEPHGNYNRIMLSPVLCGEKSIDEIMINDRSWYSDNNIVLHAGPDKTVVKIDRVRRCVISQDGTRADYDRLLIATGSKPFILPIPGNQLEGVLGFRDIFDVNKMLSYCAVQGESDEESEGEGETEGQEQRDKQSHSTRNSRGISNSNSRAVVLGGGLLGLEAANGLRQRGLRVTVIHSRDILLNRQLDREAAQLLQAELETRGVEFLLPAETHTLIGDGPSPEEGHIKAVRFADGLELKCDLFIMAIGVRPNMALAQKAGLYCERGIVVSDTLQTYDPSIYAVGECIQHRGDTFGLVAPLFDQARVCANQLSGHGVGKYKTLPSATKLKVTGIHLFSVGNFNGDQIDPARGETLDKTRNETLDATRDETLDQRTAGEALRFSDPALGVYKKLVIMNNQLVGAVLYGDTVDGAWYQQLIEQACDISAARQALIFGRHYAEPLLAQAASTETSTEAKTPNLNRAA